MAGLTNFDNVVDMDFLHLRILTMIKLLKWQSHDSVYVNVIRKSNNSANNSSHGIPTKYRLDLDNNGPDYESCFSRLLVIAHILPWTRQV